MLESRGQKAGQVVEAPIIKRSERLQAAASKDGVKFRALTTTACQWCQTSSNAAASCFSLM